MDNKLSELSKPVAYKFDHGVMGPGDFKYGTPQMHSTAKDENASPLYSQEYVSALKHESAVNWEAAASLNVENQELKKRIAELEAIRAAAEKLVRCKGRYHSEQNYRALAALFGVTTPDLPPVEGDE